jgi:hypothetical protein
MPTITIVVSRRYPVKTTPNGIELRFLPLSCALPTLYEMSDGRSGVLSTNVVGIDDEPYYVWTTPFRHFHQHNILRHSMCGIWRVVGKVVRCGNQYPTWARYHIRHLHYMAMAVWCGRSQTLVRSRNLPIAEHSLACLDLSMDLS